MSGAATKLVCAASVFVLAMTACSDVKKYTTTMEITWVEPIIDEKGVKTWTLEMKYDECPGDARRVLRADAGFAECAGVKVGDKLKADITATWDSDRGHYRTEMTKLGACALKMDRKEESNYEAVQLCTDVVTTGSVVGVHCDRTRPKAQTDKCPWLRRR